MEESDWKSMSVLENNPSSSTTGSLKNTPDVMWTSKGRAKKETTETSECHDHGDDDVSDTGNEIKADVIQDLSQWS